MVALDLNRLPLTITRAPAGPEGTDSVIELLAGVGITTGGGLGTVAGGGPVLVARGGLEVVAGGAGSVTVAEAID
ncbi:hypothetical protein ACFPJ1_25330 [Kribbella qitaiheensis]|uniref:hypothetical protein n=1 Tax=Kribbella qitaiheensis TaxID=1544730 RepID=UPI003611B86E